MSSRRARYGPEDLFRSAAERAKKFSGGQRRHLCLRGFANSVILTVMESTGHDIAIEFRDVSYSLSSGKQVVSNLDLQVRRGQTLVLLGRSGSGKTTTLKLVNRLLLPSSGEVRVNGLANGDVIRLRRSIGFVIQDGGLFPHFTVERNIALVPTIEGWPAERIRLRVQELLRIVGLDSQMASRYPRQLSGGQRQRVGVARALAADPPILLMDEPFRYS